MIILTGCSSDTMRILNTMRIPYTSEEVRYKPVEEVGGMLVLICMRHPGVVKYLKMY